MISHWRPEWLTGSRPRRGGRDVLLTLLVIVVGALVTAAAWRATRQAEERAARAALAVQATDIKAQIEAHLVAYEGLLHSGAGLIDTLWPVSAEQWRKFTNQQSFASGYPGIHGVGFSIVFRTPAEAQHWARELEPPRIYGYGEPAPDWRPESAIVLAEPHNERNLRALGFDAMSESVRREAVERARDQGAPALSGRIRLVQELDNPNPEPAFVLFAPVYEGGGVPDALEERRSRFFGAVYSAFRSAQFFGGTLAISPDNAVFEVVDADANTGGFLYRNAAAPVGATLVESRTLAVWGRRWTLRVWPGGALVSARPQATSIVAWAGAAITLLLAGVIGSLALSRRRLHERMQAAKTFAAKERALNDLLEVRVEQRTRELADRTQALEAANRELATANRDLETFSYSISHDLRSPLRALSGHVELFLESRDDPVTSQRHVNAIRANLKRMAEMIDHLLKLALVSRQPLEKAPISVGPLVSAVVEEVRRAYPHAIDFQYSATELGSVCADAALLRQVLTNLVQNAAKFSRPVAAPTITIGCQMRTRERVYFVRDNGVGFDSRYALKLFGVFERLHSAQEFEGSGIGLAIVKQIIERHGGRVWAEAEAGRGATFFFALPESLPSPRVAAA